MTATIEISTDLAAALAGWAYEEPDHHLSVVVFRGGLVTATDGKRACTIPLDTGYSAFGIERGHLISAIAAQRALGIDRENLYVSVDGRLTIVIANGVSIMAPVADLSEYPSPEVIERQFTVRGTKKTDSLLDPRYLSDITAVNDATAGKGCSVRVLSWASLDKDSKQDGWPAVFAGSTGARFAIMPMKS